MPQKKSTPETLGYANTQSADSHSDSGEVLVNSPKRSRGRPPKEISDTPSPVMKDEIIQHAKRLFRQKGYAGISINEIVEAAGITKPTLYYYFKDKESLYSSVMNSLLEHGKDYILTGLTRDASLEHNLKELTLGFFQNAPTSLVCMMKDALENIQDSGHAMMVNTMRTQLMTPFQRLFEQSIEKGEIPPSNSKDLALMYVMMMDAVNLGFKMCEGDDRDIQKESEQLVNTFLYGIAQK